MTHRPGVTTTTSRELRVGQRFTVKLDANPTTPYAWELRSPAQLKHVRLVSRKFSRPFWVEEKPGTGGTETFIFEAIAAGSEKVVLDYRRVDEKPPVTSHTLEVTVKPGR